MAREFKETSHNNINRKVYAENWDHIFKPTKEARPDDSSAVASESLPCEEKEASTGSESSEVCA